MSKKHHSPNSGGGNKSLQQSDCGSANLYTLVCTAANLITLHTHHGSHVEGKKVNAVITEHQGCLSLQTLSKHSCVTPVSICSFYTGSATCAESYEMYFMLWACCCFVFFLLDGRKTSRVAGGGCDSVWRFLAGRETTLPAGGRSGPGAAWVGRIRSTFVELRGALWMLWRMI